jgi:single-stranded-DNA-specific exonuclease
VRSHDLRRRAGFLIPGPRWRLAAQPDPAAVAALATDLQIPLPLAAVLIQRGITDRLHAREFLRPQLASLRDPADLAGMPAAVDTIVAAVRAGHVILVHGDYDVDGQCAAALLTRALRAAGATVHAFVPHRVADGYDFGAAGLAEATRIGARLIITCDCGITAVEAVAQARAGGVAVVVTDHHLPGGRLPAANAIVDPQQPGDQSGLGALCGTGIAFKLVQALVQPLGLPVALPLHLLDLVALATVADVVPLTGENRILVKHGLKLLGDTRWVGLRALIAEAGLGGTLLRASQVGFILAPRLNAVGRIGNANDGLRLLLTDDETEAVVLARHLEQCNRERQQLDQAMLDHALRMVDTDHADPDLHTGLVLAGEQWHPGVVGIVASRVVERYGRPVFVIGLDGDTGRGSGRSIDGFDLHHAVLGCSDLLVRSGGHRMAAGLTIHRDRVMAFRERFNAIARASIPPGDLGPSQRVDLELTMDQVTDDLEAWSRRLEPCGMGNPAPVFGARAVRLEQPCPVGANHLKGMLAGAGARIDTIAFNWADRVAAFGDVSMDAAFRLERNEWNGRSLLQARALALSPTRP